MVSDGAKLSQGSSIPPRKINVQKFAEARAPELDSLHSIVANRLNNNFRSRRNKRRRTTAHDNQGTKRRSRKRRKLVVVDKSNASDLEKDHKKISRRIRRRIELKKNPESGFSTSGDGTKRLRTHVWHAKRFTMKKLWGYYLPLGLQGRGRGSRALLKWFKEGVVVHDASYYIAVQLEGPEDSLMSILQMVLVPSLLSESEDVSRSVLSGVTYGSAMLHHVGAPFSQPIAPVTYMWKPFHGWDGEDYANCDAAVGSNAIECHSCFRQIWLWIHASAFNEGYDALKLASQKQMNETGALLNCFSLEGQLGKLEVTGSKAFQLLQKTLDPVSGFPKTSWQLQRCSLSKADDVSQDKEFSLIENDEHISSCAILSLIVKDPRPFPHESLSEISNMSKDLISDSCSKFDEKRFFNDKSIWDITSRMSLPMEESVLCMEKHQQHMAFLHLDDPKSVTWKASNKAQCSRTCPILLLKNKNQKGSPEGWSVLLPLSWVRVFWNSIVSKGAHAIGLREKHWIACNTGLPYFPSDFPDCNSYASFMVTEAAASDQKAELRPASVRPFKVPIPPPWNSVCNSLNKAAIGEQDAKFSCGDVIVGDNSLLETTCSRINMTSFVSQDSSFDKIVARTSGALTLFMNQIHGEHLPLFPQLSNQRTSFMKLMRSESKLGLDQNGIAKINYNHKLCFLRVLLHAYKEGVFEEGAVVCAPSLTDISLWTSSSGSNEIGLQMPESSVRSYFKELSSSKWELQLPEDPTSRQSMRWPIGFVTTGFVRGSKKPVATAFCEAVLLARLREEQWNEMPVKRRRKEIYVLVRNLRSSAYRLALATIVLEQQEEDVNFM